MGPVDAVVLFSIFMRVSNIHRPDRLQFPFPRAMLTVEIFAMADDNQRARPQLVRVERAERAEGPGDSCLAALVQ